MDEHSMKVFENLVLKGNIQTLTDSINRLEILHLIFMDPCIVV